jgi:hypothetical protein
LTICTDTGRVIHDFAGTNTIGRDNFLFGVPTRYVQLDVAPDQVGRWDEAVAKGSATYSHHSYNLMCVLPRKRSSHQPPLIGPSCACSLDNCHSYVAECLTQFPGSGRGAWNMVILCFWVFVHGQYVDIRGLLKSWLPFTLVVLAAIGSSSL